MAMVGTALVLSLKEALNSLGRAAIERLYARYKRVQAVHNALVTIGYDLDPAVATALSDVHAAIGREGLLTDRMAEFLMQLSNSGVIDHLAAIAVTRANSRGTLAAFKFMYQSHFGENSSKASSDAKLLYEAILRMLRASLVRNNDAEKYFAAQILMALNSNDEGPSWGHLSPEAGRQREVDALSRTVVTALREMATEGETVMRGRFTATTAEGKEVSESELLANDPSLVQSQGTVGALIDHLTRAMSPLFSTIRVEGPSMRSVEVPAELIYVEPRLWPITLSPIDTNDVAPRTSSTEPDVSVATFVAQLEKAAIVGDPGGGKSTLVRMICRKLLAQASTSGGPLPIFVTLRRYYSARNNEASLSLFEYILRDLAQQTNAYSVEELRLPIRHLLTFGRAIVIFDGLDEIVSVAKRREFASAVSQFVSLYGLCRFIATSRKVDYKRVSIAGFSTFELAPFDDGLVQKYVELSARNVFNRNEDAVEKESERFMGEAGKNAAEFLGNPLLLSLIVWLFNSTQKIPDNRAQIYEECSRLLFERWDSLREISANVPEAYRLFSLLGHLAHKMYLDPSLQAGASRAWLTSSIREFFISDYSDNAESRAADAASRFLEHLSGRAWVLREMGSDTYEFTHRTFMEYFFARDLNDKHLSFDGLFDKLSPRIVASEWNVPVHLAIQIAVAGKRTYADRAVERLISLYEATDQKQRASIVEFIAQATEYLQPPEPSLERITRILTLESRNDDSWRRSFMSVLQTPNDMREAIFRGLGAGFGDLVRAGRLNRIAFVFDWLKAVDISQKAGFAVKPPTRVAMIGVIHKQLTRGLLEPLEASEPVNAAACKARFDLTGELEESLVSQFGLRLWQASSEGPLYRRDWRAVDFAAMIHEYRLLFRGEAKLESCRYALLAAALAKMNFDRTPISITTAPLIVATVVDVDFSPFFESTALDGDMIAGLCFAVCGYHECRRFIVRSELTDAGRVPLGDLYAVLRPSLVASGKALEFFDAWFAGKRTLFQLIAKGSVARIEDILR